MDSASLWRSNFLIFSWFSAMFIGYKSRHRTNRLFQNYLTFCPTESWMSTKLPLKNNRTQNKTKARSFKTPICLKSILILAHCHCSDKVYFKWEINFLSFNLILLCICLKTYQLFDEWEYVWSSRIFVHNLLNTAIYTLFLTYLREELNSV